LGWGDTLSWIEKYNIAMDDVFAKFGSENVVVLADTSMPPAVFYPDVAALAGKVVIYFPEGNSPRTVPITFRERSGVRVLITARPMET